jgi:type IV pilus assembly protein PilF
LLAAKSDPAADTAPITMGWFWTERGSAEKAAAWMKRAVDQSPDSPRVRLGTAFWLLYQRKPEPAKTHAEAALKLDPKSKEIQLLCAMVARHLKDYDAAEKSLDTLHRAEPDNATVANQLALVLAESAEQEKRARALDLAEKTAKTQPNSPEALSTLGRVYFRMDRLKDAEKALQTVRAGADARSDSGYYMACVLVALERPREAVDVLKGALGASGPFIHEQDARQLLEKLEKTTR